MESAVDRESDPGFWRECLEAERQEYVRSERVQTQLQTVLQSLQQRRSDLQAETDRIQVDVQPDASTKCLENEVEAALQARQALEARQNALSVEIHRHSAECEARAAEAAANTEMLEESAVARDAIEKACRKAECRRDEATQESRSMVMAETLHNAAEEAARLKVQLQAQEAETAELREALADSWAARADADSVEGDAAPSSQTPVDSGAALQELRNMQEELQWLAKMQQEAAAEVHHVQKLERTEVALQSQLRSVMEENATLRSNRMDLGDAGRTMREAIASQSERYVGRVGVLAEERKRTDTDREKLMQECAELQLRLDSLNPELVELVGLEERHGELEAERSAIAAEIERLHTINGSLGVLLLGEDGAPPSLSGDDGGAASVAEAITRLLNLQRRLSDREASHVEEKQRLADRIRSLERDAATTATLEREPQAPPSAAALNKGSAAQGAKKATSSVPVPLSKASSVLKGGFKSFREAAGV